MNAPDTYRRLDKLAHKYGTDKGSMCHDYMRTYAELLAPMRDSARHVLEVGLARRNWAGNKAKFPSLMVWRDFFGKATIHGVDRRDFPGPWPERIVIHRNDQSQLIEMARLGKTLADLDVVIDDGSHIANDQFVTLLALWPRVYPGGYYVVEDLHCTRDVPAENLFKTEAEAMESGKRSVVLERLFGGDQPVEMGFGVSREKGTNGLVWFRKGVRS